VIKVINVTKRFDEKIAINSLSVDIKPGITGIVGQNGAGKSTLLRMMAGVYQTSEGTIVNNGHLSNTQKSKEIVFFLPDNPYAPINVDIKGVYEFYAMFYKIDKEKFYQLIALFKLPLKTGIHKFSKGMKRLVFVALALSINVDILLLDEAFDGLDPLVLQIVKEQLVKLCEDENKIIVISSHNINSLEKFADRFIIMNEGIVRTDGELESIGEKFVKYQAVFPEGIDYKELMEKNGLKIVSYKKVGSFVTFVVLKDENIDIEKYLSTLGPSVLEEIPIDPEEVVIFEMALASKEAKYE